MDYSIVYSSRTGNTAMLAGAIKEVLPEQKCLYFGTIGTVAIDSDIVFVGFWTEKGTCDSDTKNFLKTLKNKKVFLFGTAGFGGQLEYYEKILEAVAQNLDPSNKLIGTYMCQGKMPAAVSQRYEKMAAENPENLKFKDMLENFDRAASHPDVEDCHKLQQQVSEMFIVE